MKSLLHSTQPVCTPRVQPARCTARNAVSGLRFVAAVAMVVFAAAPVGAYTTVRVGIARTGVWITLSADGRYAAFESDLPYVVPNFSNPDGREHVYVYDRLYGAYELITVNNAGQPGNRGGEVASISADGRFVAFTSYSSNLVDG